MSRAELDKTAAQAWLDTYDDGNANQKPAALSPVGQEKVSVLTKVLSLKELRNTKNTGST